MAEPLAGLQAAVADRYVLERELGRGGMAFVFLARDLKHDRPVALKVLRPDLAAALGVERFLREIQIAARLTHPHILPLHDSGEAKGFIYYVMPFVEGESLRARLNRERQLPLDEALRTAREVADALSYAHSHDIVHRDIKPENILLSGGHALVADFGIARAITAAGKQRVTESGIAVGTPAYMSPEQAGADPQLDGRSDIYSLACVVYEMLGGEPPFTGPSAQAILARKTADPVPPLRTVRDTVPERVERAITTALAKVPADRFPTAAQFAEALAAPPGPQRPVGPLPTRRWRAVTVVAFAGAAALGLAAWISRLLVARAPALDLNRIVVYPLTVSSEGPSQQRLGEDVATIIGSALDGTEPLKWLDGWHWLDGAQREDARLLSARAARSIARAQRAGFYIDGRVIWRGDSADVILRLRDVSADSTLKQASASGLAGQLVQSGLRAVARLLPALLSAGEAVDLTSLSDRSPGAIANFLEGERAYRRGRFQAALEHYQNAVRTDPAFALAALKAAEAASWNNTPEQATELIRAVLERAAWTAPRYVEFARGFVSYLAGRADSAVSHFRRAIELDPQWPDPWMALGDVYTHLLPRDSPLDSLADAAFAEVRRLNPGFTPVLYHLIEIALRKGEVGQAARLVRELREANPDSALLVPADLMLRCVQKSPEAVDWPGAVRGYPGGVVAAGYSLAPGGFQATCSRAAFGALVGYDVLPDRAARARRFNAIVGLQSLLVAERRYNELVKLLEGARAQFPSQVEKLYILDALAGADVEVQAREAARRLKESYRSRSQLNSYDLWFLGIWEAGRGGVAEAHAIADSLASRAAESGNRVDSLLAKSMAARAALARGDSTRALALLEGLVPTGGNQVLAWHPWESLGGERLALADQLFARGKVAEALRIAANFDAPAPLTYVLYLPASLSLRMRAAGALGYRSLAEQCRARLAVLGRPELAAGVP